MRLTRRTSIEEKKQDKVVEPMSAADRAMFYICDSQQLPVGKFQGMTVKWVKENEPWYYSWLCKNEPMMITWGILRLKGDALGPKKQKYNKYYTDDNTIWLELREVLERSSSWEITEKWLFENPK